MEIINNHILIVVFILAFLLDLVMGDPPWLPHPVRIIGKGITVLEYLLTKSASMKAQEKLAGILLAVMIVLSTFLIAYITEKWILFGTQGIIKLAGIVFLVYLTSTTLATKELLRAGFNVIEALKEDNIFLARRHLSMIVGRDVDSLDKKDILKATMETISENLSDGVIAPLFYLAIGGMPLGLVYKAINTLDSMVGYKNEKYIRLGWASARLDDLANYIPARISGLLIVLSSGVLFRSRQIMRYAFITMYRDGRKHASPNSGYPEAAMAGALGVKLGGPSTYGGVLFDKPYIGSERTEEYLSASLDTIRIVKMASFFGFFISIGVLCLRAIL
ncbi:MAG: adenosylcobinamide-phosphate synthase CbiB [Proteobacteria bacterium]|nr:adenosylcobinamide-phosphate synthase CbiB [Pseudomonadota bacterium]